jgi:hypothetical protein
MNVWLKKTGLANVFPIGKMAAVGVAVYTEVVCHNTLQGRCASHFS